MCSRPSGVRQALLWVSIRFAPPRITGVGDISLDPGNAHETMNNLLGYITDNCCRGKPEQCVSVKPAPKRTKETGR
jgi:hypothetical protein